MSLKYSILNSASEARLEKLIKKRLEKGADKDKIDKNIWDLFGEEWCVMATDLSGFSRHVMKFGIIHFLQTIYESERLLIPIIEKLDGIFLKQEGDSLLVIFRNVEKAVKASLEMRSILKEYNQGKTDEEKVLLCIGLGYGKMLHIGDTDVYGSEVNAASKLGEDTAQSDEILVTEEVMNRCSNLADISFEEIQNTPPGSSKAYKLIQK